MDFHEFCKTSLEPLTDEQKRLLRINVESIKHAMMTMSDSEYDDAIS